MRREHLAGLAGFSLGSVTAISESHGHAPFEPQARALSASKAYDSAINIVPDEQNVVVSLQVHFAWA